MAMTILRGHENTGKSRLWRIVKNICENRTYLRYQYIQMSSWRLVSHRHSFFLALEQSKQKMRRESGREVPTRLSIAGMQSSAIRPSADDKDWGLIWREGWGLFSERRGISQQVVCHTVLSNTCILNSYSSVVCGSTYDIFLRWRIKQLHTNSISRWLDRRAVEWCIMVIATDIYPHPARYRIHFFHFLRAFGLCQQLDAWSSKHG